MITNPSPRIPSLSDFDRRARRGDALTVVFFGGSLTWGANASDPNKTSYRGLMATRLRTFYPNARWTFIDAAIGGTGSSLGVFRAERDVLAYSPDLVFLDFTLNDGMDREDPETLSSYESIVRMILSKGQCPVMPVILCSKDFAMQPDLSVLKRRTRHLELAEYYGLTVGDVVGGMNALYKAGKLDVDTLWPADLFDTCHPYDPGYAVYAGIVWKAFQQGINAHASVCWHEEWLNAEAYRNMIRAELTDLDHIPKGWRVGKPEIRAGTFDFLSSRWMDRVLIAENCTRTAFDRFELSGITPEPLQIDFRGSSIDLIAESTIFSGSFIGNLDGKEFVQDVHFFGDMFAPSAFLFIPIAKGLDPDQEHHLTITPKFDPEKPQQIHLSSICIAGPKEVRFSPC